VITLEKATLALFTIACLLSSLLCISALVGNEMSARGAPSTWIVNVNGSGNFRTIQQAIDHANPGDTIRVHNGTYYEQVSINKSISLIGDGANFTIIDGNGTGDVMNIMANGVVVQGFTISRSQISPNYAGIRVERSSDVAISQNRVVYNYRGVVFSSCSSSSIVDDILSYNSIDGLGFFSSSDNAVMDNIVSNNFVNGIAFFSSNNNSLLSNVVLHNSVDGIAFSSCTNNLISRNVISSNENSGITLSSSSNNTISGNTISNNLNGLILFYSGNNQVYHNNFEKNEFQVLDESTSVSMWNDNGEGNYWTDYKGRDLNGDGMGDVPYIIDSNNRDEYPLMGTFSVFSATLSGKTHDIAVICNSTISDFRFGIGPETGNKIIQFNVTSSQGASGFCRIAIPTELMDNSSIMMIGQEELSPLPLLPVSNETFSYSYFTYMDGVQTIRIISSEALRSYNELRAIYRELQNDLHGLNLTYDALLNNYTVLLSSYNALRESYHTLNASYQEHLLDYSASAQNLRNLTYIFAFATGILLVSVIYLSGRKRVTLPTVPGTSDDKK
jgi:parallel beta-helix repeat protein